jgi:hypothetical protein
MGLLSTWVTHYQIKNVMHTIRKLELFITYVGFTPVLSLFFCFIVIQACHLQVKVFTAYFKLKILTTMPSKNNFFD